MPNYIDEDRRRAISIDDRTALFLDVDGTLLDYALTPEAVEVPEGLPRLLAELRDALGGALALVSGRTIPWLDQAFGPERFICAGEHGAEVRMALDGQSVRDPIPAWRDVLAREVARDIEQWPGIVVEWKPSSISMHYRLVPALEPKLRAAVADLVRPHRPWIEVMHGHQVIELRAPGASKGSAIATLMDTAVFRGRRPVMVGDDVTDEEGFKAVRALDGVAVAVGPRPSANANAYLPDPDCVRRWLSEELACLAGAPPPRILEHEGARQARQSQA